jgi:hypothetical protein
MRTLQLYIEGQRTDLFNDETIEITQTIQNIRDISKVFTDFTKTFSIPASKANNLIFKHYYNFSIDNTFDARVKVNATIEINNIVYRKGKIRLDGVDLKKNAPYAYRVTFFGNTVDLKDLLGEDKLSGLQGLDDYNQTYSATAVRTALTAGVDVNGYTDAIIVPLISHTHYLFYDTSTSGALSRNMWPIPGSPGVQQGVYYQDLKYAIKLHILILAIQETYGLTFSGDFFFPTDTRWSNVYMWLHRKKGNVFEGQNFTTLVTGLSPTATGTNVIVQTDRVLVFGFSPNVTYTLTLTTAAAQTYTVTIKKDGAVYATALCDNTTSVVLSGNLTWSSTGYQVFIEASSSFTVGVAWSISDVNNAQNFNPTVSIALNTALDFIITEQLPDMKVIDFLTGVFKVFNLTAYEKNGVIQVKDLDDYYSEGRAEPWDLTQYINYDSSTVDSALPYKEIELGYQGRGTKLAKNHEELFNDKWGTALYTGDDNYDSAPDIYKVVAPFEHMKYERLYDGNSSTRLNVMTGWFVDDNDLPYYGLPLIFYGVQNTGTTIRFLNDLSTSQSDISTYFLASNSLSLSSATSTLNLNYNLEINEWSQATDFTGTLFQSYYSNYLTSVYSTRKRISRFDAELPVGFLTQYSLADKILIGSNTYLINSIQTNLNTGKSKLELLNITNV